MKVQTDPTEIIDRFLLSDRAPENAMGLSDLDGLLTGLAIGPKVIMPSVWLPVVWGGDSPKFKTTKEAEEIFSALMGWYNGIIRGFQHQPPIFDPIFWETKDGIVIAADWAEGFNDAINLRRKAWQPLFDDKKHSRLLRPISVLCCEYGGEPTPDPETESELMAKATDDLAASIIGIHSYWKKRTKP